MQRIARLHNQSANEALDGYADLHGVLRRHLPPSTANMYARPKPVEGGIVEWYSELGGQPIPLQQLDATHPKQAAAARRLLAERLAAVSTAADHLVAQGADNAAQTERLRQLLQLAARRPAEKDVYVLDGQPVITAWGGGEPPAPPVTPLIEPAAVPRKRRWWWLWLLLLALALLGGLLWWLYCRAPDTPLPPAVEAPVAQEPAAEKPPAKEPPTKEPVVEEPVTEEPPVQTPPEDPKPPVAQPAPDPEPRPTPKPPPPPPPPDPVAELRKRISRAGKDCNALQKLQKNEPLLKSNSALRKELDQQLLKHCKARLITQAKNLCPNERPPELAPELVIVFDASGSMDYSLLASAQDIRKARNAQTGLNMVGGLFGIPLPNPLAQSVFREPKRISTARQATTALVKQLPSDTSAGLVLVEQCPAARSIGFFPPAQRSQLLARLQGIAPKEGTPLADGVRRAGALLDGVNRESVMLVVSDGEESCGQDPCAVARELARNKPHLKINVIDITGTGAGNCLAAATGGQVFTANNVSDLQRMTRQAARDVLPPAHCRP